jgi:Spy/CpxP family protein refolding chaperone
MSQQNWNSNGRWLKLSLVTLVVLNLALMASIWLPQLKRSPAKDEKIRGMGGREHDIALQFLEETLKLTPQQKENTAKLRDAHFLKTDALRKEINLLRRQIMDEVLVNSPDKEKVERLAAQLGEKQGGLEKLTFHHFLNLYNLCQPGQKEKFRSMMNEMLNRLKPSPPDSPRRPGDEYKPKPSAANPPPPRGEGKQWREWQPAKERIQRNGAGRQGRPEESGDELSRTRNQIEGLRSRLGLSDGQVEKLLPLAEKYARQIDECRSNETGDPDTRRQEEKMIKDQRDEAIKSQLTGEQKILFEQMKKEKRGQKPPPKENK